MGVGGGGGGWNLDVNVSGGLGLRQNVRVWCSWIWEFNKASVLGVLGLEWILLGIWCGFRSLGVGKTANPLPWL